MVVGNFIGQSIDGLGNLLHMPCGCGEQTMIYFAPDVYILKYLRITHQNTQELEQLALSYITSGKLTSFSCNLYQMRLKP